MKGLILKDLYTFFGQGKQLFTMLAIFIVSFAFMDTIALIPMFTIIASMWVLNTFHFDESCRWLEFAFAAPYTKAEIVLSKYIFAVVLTAIGPVIGFISTIIGGLFKNNDEVILIGDVLIIAAVSIMIALVSISVAIPAYFKYGAAKGRMVVMSLYLALTLGLTILASNTSFISGIGETLDRQQNVLAAAAGAVCVLMVGVSIALSIGILKKKEV